jgi:hypothetical protein
MIRIIAILMFASSLLQSIPQWLYGIADQKECCHCWQIQAGLILWLLAERTREPQATKTAAPRLKIVSAEEA